MAEAIDLNEKPELEFFERSVERMRKAGYKLTPQRTAILELFCNHFEHLTPQSIFQRLEGSVASLSLATVYNSLELFEQVGILTRVCNEHGQTYFDPNNEPHHHAICQHCETIFDLHVPAPLLEQLLEATSAEVRAGTGDFAVCDARIWFRGVCSNCR